MDRRPDRKGYQGPRQPGDPRHQQRASGGPPGGPRQDGRARERGLDELWPGYLASGYFERDAAGEPVLRPEFLKRATVEPLVRQMAHSDPPLTSSQLRRFFQHCRAIEARLRGGGSSWEQERASFLKLGVAAADAWGKKPPKIPAIFYEFLRRNVDAVVRREDFLEGFLAHFEALVGFGSLHLKEKERT